MTTKTSEEIAELRARVKRIEDRQTEVLAKLDDLGKGQDKENRRVDDLISKLDGNSITTHQIKLDTAKILSAWEASKFGATLVKWCAGVAAGLAAVYAAFKGMR